MVTVIDLDIGNLQSVVNAFRRVHIDVSIATHVRDAEGASILVLPGVGAFERAMSNLHARGFGPLISKHVRERQAPLIGICLGMQLLADRSYEHGITDGLGLIPGEVVRLEAEAAGERVPNIGWMPVRAAKPSVMFPEGVDGESFYHVHSYHLACSDPSDVAGTVEFGGERVVTAVERGNVFGMQFHPEKSQDAGLNLLNSLLRHLKSRAT